MGKYDPLRDYLKRQRASQLELTFTEIERMVGKMLPNRAIRAEWWENAHDRHAPSVQQNAWQEAGYNAVLVVGHDRVRFTRAE